VTPDPRERFLTLLREALAARTLKRLVLSRPVRPMFPPGFTNEGPVLQRLRIQPVRMRDGVKLAFAWQYDTRDQTDNLSVDEALVRIDALLGDMRTALLETRELTAELGFSKRGRPLFRMKRVAESPSLQDRGPAADDLPNPAGGTVVHRVLSAKDMADKVGEVAGEQDVIIMAAAVADVRPAHQAAVKLKKGADSQALGQLELVENPDILAGLTEIRSTGIWEKNPVIVGFAAETGDDGATPLDHAVAKLQRKGCDLLMCNEVGAGKVFGQDTNSGWMVFPDGRVVDVLPGSKLEVAAQIMDEVVELMPPLSS